MSFIKGVGLSYREVFQNDLEELRKDVNFLEIIAESYFDEKRIEEIIKLKNYFPLIPHGLSLSIGSYEDIPLQKLNNIIKLAKITETNLYTEHLALSESRDISLLDFIPVIFNDETIEWIKKKLQCIHSLYPTLTIALENIVNTFQWTIGTYSEAEFFEKILKETDATLLLDITNLYINAINNNYDPYKFIDGIPKEKIQVAHVSGYSKNKYGMLIDSHSEPINKEIFDLLEYSFKKTPIEAVILERDLKLENYGDVKKDILAIKNLYSRYKSVKI